MSTMNQCQICSALAKGISFGVLACPPCRVFFKRNAHKILTCRFENECEINVHTRHACSSCRLKKCLQLGMSQEKFRPSREFRTNAEHSVQRRKHNQLQESSIINILQPDQSLLTNDQWTLISNLFSCYKESQISSDVERLIIADENSQLSFVNYQHLIDEFSVSVYGIVETYLRINDDLRQLSFDDRSNILRSAADNVCCMGAVFILQHFHLYDLQNFINGLNKKYGKSTIHIYQRARQFIDPDTVLIKLAISLYAFSENTSRYRSESSDDLTNPISAYKIQSKYAEVTWQYLLHRHYRQEAIQRFLNITLWMSSVDILTLHAQTLNTHLNDIYSVVEQTELALILGDLDASLETNHS